MPSPDPQLVAGRSLRHVATAKIKAAILDGTLRPGETLKDEDLMAWLGMSRSPIRDALSTLARIGMVDRQAQRFTRVAGAAPATVEYDYQAVGALLGGVVRGTVAVVGTEGCRALTAATTRVLACLEERDFSRYLGQTRELCQQFVRCCPNPVLVEATEDVLDAMFYRVTLSPLRGDVGWDRLGESYRALRHAIQSGDAIAARLAIEDAFQLDTPISP